MPTQMPWKELGYTAAFVCLLAALYVGSYIATVGRVNSSVPYTVSWCESVKKLDDGEFKDHRRGVTEQRWKVYRAVEPTYSTLDGDLLKRFFRPVHEVDRRLRSEYWKDQDLGQDAPAATIVHEEWFLPQSEEVAKKPGAYGPGLSRSSP